MKTQVLSIHPGSLHEGLLQGAASILRRGGLVAFPTDTVYGLGAHFFNDDAIEHLYRVKRRPREKPFPMLIEDKSCLDEYVSSLPVNVRKFTNSFWPGPLTLILLCDRGILKGKKIGFRVPDDPIARLLLRVSEFPLAAPSANHSGKPSPKNAHEVLSDLDGEIDLIIDGGACKIGRESTVVEIIDGELNILRYGSLSREKIDTCLSLPDIPKGKVKSVLFVCTGNSCRSVIAEYLLKEYLRDRVDIRISSAGTTAYPGMQPTQHAISVMQKKHIDINGHLSCPVTPNLIDNTDLILVMTKAHKRFLLEMLSRPGIDSNKIHLLMDFSSRWDFLGTDVEDPIGQPYWAYENCLEMMLEPMDRIARLL
ncbi:MAG: L-threonylcarbamoyladenylate synthase [Chlamydiota bacterium]|nr:L-threonylcarbamoyladenylate synthase [Chlamydiota bacterium]